MIHGTTKHFVNIKRDCKSTTLADTIKTFWTLIVIQTQHILPVGVAHSIHPRSRSPVIQIALGLRSTPLPPSHWSVKTRHAPSQHCRDERVYGHTTTAMHELEYISPIEYTPYSPPLPPPTINSTFVRHLCVRASASQQYKMQLVLHATFRTLASLSRSAL